MPNSLFPEENPRVLRPPTFRRLSAGVLLVLLACPLPLFSQARILGKVIDGEGDPISSGTVNLATITAGEVRQAGISPSGEFSLTSIRPGRYVLTVSSIGFRTSSDTLDLASGETRTVTITLQEEALEEHEMVVTATRTARDIASIPFRVEIIPAEDLDESITTGLASAKLVLAELPGVMTQVTSSGLGASTVRLHGLDGRYTEILVDGIPAFGGLNLNFSLLQLPPLNLRQLEIIKGSSAGLHSDAIGGVVNYITKLPRRSGQELTAVVNETSLGGTDLAGFYSRQLDDWGVVLHATYSASPRRDLDGDGLADVQLQHRFNLNPKIVWNPGDRTRLAFAANLTSEDRLGGEMSAPEDFSTGIPGLYSTALRTRRIDCSTSYSWTPDDRTTVNANGMLARTQRNSYLGTSSFDGTEDILYADGSWSGAVEDLRLTVGASELSQRFRETSFDSLAGGRRDYLFNDLSGFLQAEVPLTTFITGMSSLRWDHHNRYGDVLSPRLSLMAKLPHNLTLRLSAGTGWHAPGLFDEKAEQVGYVGVPPVGGVPRESAFSVSFDAHHRLLIDELAITTDLDLFSTNVSHRVDLVAADTGPSGVKWNREDVGSLRSRGAEVLLNGRLGGWSIAFGYTFADITELTGGVRSVKPLTPSHFLNGTFGWENPLHTRIAGDFLFESTQQLPPNPYRESSPSFATFGISIEEWFTPTFSLFLNAENAFDARQTHTMPLSSGTPGTPGFNTDLVWGPVEGRVVNLGAKVSLQ